MIVAWLIGLILSFLGIWFLKNSRQTQRWNNSKGGQPILKMWILIFLLICAVFPIVNIIAGLATIIWWIIETYGDEDWEFTKNDNKIVQFLNKPIK